jgi:hypothetical protein
VIRFSGIISGSGKPKAALCVKLTDPEYKETSAVKKKTTNSAQQLEETTKHHYSTHPPSPSPRSAPTHGNKLSVPTTASKPPHHHHHLQHRTEL